MQHFSGVGMFLFTYCVGEAIILLGTRSDESPNRARSIKKHEIARQRLRKHILPHAFVYAPIKDVTTNELWQYMMQVAPSWGGTYKELVTLLPQCQLRRLSAGDWWYKSILRQQPVWLLGMYSCKQRQINGCPYWKRRILDGAIGSHQGLSNTVERG